MRTLSRQHLRRRMIRIAADWTVAELTTTFTNGGGGGGDVGDGTNWDNGVPTSTDDAILAATPTNGSVSCHDLSGSSHLNGATITVYGTATGITVDSGVLTAPFGLLQAVGCIFNAPPGTNVSGTSSCQYNADFTGLSARSVMDDGTGTFGAYTFGGLVTWTGTWSQTAPTLTAGLAATAMSNGTVSGNVTLSGSFTGGTITGSSATYTIGSISGGSINDSGTGTLNCNSITGGSLTNLGIHQTGAGVKFTGATVSGCTVSWSGVTSIANVDMTNYSVSGTTATIVNVGGTSSTVTYTVASSGGATSLVDGGLAA